MKPLIKLLVASLFLVFAVSYLTFSIYAQECPASDYDCQIKSIQRDIDALSPAHEKNKKDLAELKNQLTLLEKKIVSISKSLDKLEADIKKRGNELDHAKAVFEEKTNKYYRKLRFYDSVAPFIFSEDAPDFFREVSIRKKTIEEDEKLILSYVVDLEKFNQDRDTLEKTKISINNLRSKVDGKAEFLQEEVDKVQNYLNQMTAKQQELSALKSGGFSTSVGDTPETLEPCSGPPGSSNFCDPGFKPAFAAFSFGAPHRTGMSQYGAYGRAKGGQSAEEILSAYYKGSSLNKSYSVPATIGVTGIGRIAFEENYLLGIYEIPEKWGDEGGYEALKAQAVAARTYALAVTGNGSGSICTTEACQVYKPQLKSGKWAQAVRETRGWVLIKDGNPAKTYYASTSGGFTISQWGWEGIKDALGDWPGGAYEKTAGSPWFYKGWYKARSGATCGRSNPWLTSSDMGDILNAWKVLYQGGGDISKISPLDTGCWKGNPYSKEELKGIGGFDTVSSVSVIYSNSGFTSTLNFSTNKGNISISGDEFKKAFNLRAPGYVGIKSSLFNIEKL